MDNLVSAGANIQEAFDIYKIAKHIMYRGGFNLGKWNSNSSVLLERIRQSEQDLAPTNLDEKDGTANSSSVTNDATNVNKLLGIN